MTNNDTQRTASCAADNLPPATRLTRLAGRKVLTPSCRATAASHGRTHRTHGDGGGARVAAHNALAADSSNGNGKPEQAELLLREALKRYDAAVERNEAAKRSRKTFHKMYTRMFAVMAFAVVLRSQAAMCLVLYAVLPLGVCAACYMGTRAVTAAPRREGVAKVDEAVTGWSFVAWSIMMCVWGPIRVFGSHSLGLTWEHGTLATIAVMGCALGILYHVNAISRQRGTGPLPTYTGGLLQGCTSPTW